jgi:hypothetical protein
LNDLLGEKAHLAAPVNKGEEYHQTALKFSQSVFGDENVKSIGGKNGIGHSGDIEVCVHGRKILFEVKSGEYEYKHVRTAAENAINTQSDYVIVCYSKFEATNMKYANKPLVSRHYPKASVDSTWMSRFEQTRWQCAHCILCCSSLQTFLDFLKWQMPSRPRAPSPF